eukprot:scaffold73267_cov67-Phaeocystis_antarctica.AAC.2
MRACCFFPQCISSERSTGACDATKAVSLTALATDCDAWQHAGRRGVGNASSYTLCNYFLKVRTLIDAALWVGAEPDVLTFLDGGSRFCECLTHGDLRRGAGRDAVQVEPIERWQRAAVERSGEGGAAGVGDLGVAEVEARELRQPSSRRRQHTCRRRRRHEGGEALVADWVAVEIEMHQRGQLPQGRREGHQPSVADGGAA